MGERQNFGKVSAEVKLSLIDLEILKNGQQGIRMDTCCRCKKESEKLVTQMIGNSGYKICPECADEMIKILLPQKESLVCKLFDEINGIVGKFLSEKALEFIQPSSEKDNKGEPQ